jgi:hypothetical protein
MRECIAFVAMSREPMSLWYLTGLGLLGVPLADAHAT